MDQRDLVPRRVIVPNIFDMAFHDLLAPKHLGDIFEGQPNKTGVKKTKEGKMYLEIPVPGFTKDDLDIQFLEDGRVIEVAGKRDGFDGEECRFTHHNVIRKPIEIEKAVCENGLLRIEFKDGVKKRQIAIE